MKSGFELARMAWIEFVGMNAEWNEVDEWELNGRKEKTAARQIN